MAETKSKGDLGESMVIADLLRKGYKVAIPLGEDWKFDIIALINGELKRIQCKYVEEKNGVISIPCRSCNGRLNYKYTEKDFDWLSCYDSTNDKCYYIPSSLLGESGRTYINLRLRSTKNNQNKNILWASDYTEL